LNCNAREFRSRALGYITLASIHLSVPRDAGCLSQNLGIPYNNSLALAAPRHIPAMKKASPGSGETLERLKLTLYLVPVFGVVPAVFSLWQKQGSRQELAVSRLVVTLALTWDM
jgi:hypothetical protein